MPSPGDCRRFRTLLFSPSALAGEGLGEGEIRHSRSAGDAHHLHRLPERAVRAEHPAR